MKRFKFFSYLSYTSDRSWKLLLRVGSNVHDIKDGMKAPHIVASLKLLTTMFRLIGVGYHLELCIVVTFY